MMPPAIGRPPRDDQPHRGAGGVPAARHQAAEQRRARRRIVEMERLRVIVRGEARDLRRIHRVRAADEALPDGQVIQIELVHRISIAGAGRAGLRCRAEDRRMPDTATSAADRPARRHPRRGRRARPADRSGRYRRLYRGLAAALPRPHAGGAPPRQHATELAEVVRLCAAARRADRAAGRQYLAWSAAPRRPRTAARSC